MCMTRSPCISDSNERDGDLKEALLGQISILEQSILKNQKLIVKSLMSLLEDLDLDIKYLEFDNHAIKSENYELVKAIKRMLEDGE